MTIIEWQRNEQLVKWMASLLRSHEGQAMMLMLAESHVKNAVRNDLGNPSQNSADLGRIYGYDVCINNLFAAAKLKQDAKPLAETFGVAKPTKK